MFLVTFSNSANHYRLSEHSLKVISQDLPLQHNGQYYYPLLDHMIDFSKHNFHSLYIQLLPQLRMVCLDHLYTLPYF